MGEKEGKGKIHGRNRMRSDRLCASVLVANVSSTQTTMLADLPETNQRIHNTLEREREGGTRYRRSFGG